MIFILEVWIATQYPKDTVIKPEPSFRHLPSYELHMSCLIFVLLKHYIFILCASVCFIEPPLKSLREVGIEAVRNEIIDDS